MERSVLSCADSIPTESIENPARPSQIITDENSLRASPAELTPGEISDLNDLMGNDFFPLANRLEPIT